MGEMTVYKVGLAGEVTLQAESEADAKSKALAYFAESPQQYVRILEISTVITPEEPE